jgi:hypothetical protein
MSMGWETWRACWHPVSMMLLLLLACADDPFQPPTSPRDSSASDTGASSDGGSTDGGSSDGGSATDSGGTDVGLPLGDNLVRRGDATATGLLEPTGMLVLDPAHVALCAGASPLAIYDVSDHAAPTAIGEVPFPAPAGGFRCQHLAATADGRLLASHHGDETSGGWLGLADVSDPNAMEPLAGWNSPGVAPEGIATSGDIAWVAAHNDGLLRFDLSSDTLSDPTTVSAVTGNVSVVAVSDTTLAVGTLDGDVQLLDLNGSLLGSVVVSGPVNDLVFLADGSLVVACGSSGIDRIDVDAQSVVAHTDGRGSALDIAVLGDENLAVASWADLRIYEPVDLGLIGVEDPAEPGEDAALLTLDAEGDNLYLGEWFALLDYQWDPTVSAPDLHVDLDSVDFGTVDSGTKDAFAYVLRNEGPKPLTVTSISVDNSAVSVDAAGFTIEPDGASFIELRWTSTGTELAAQLQVVSDDPDEGALVVPITANRPGIGIGDSLPEFSYIAVNSSQVVDSSDLGGPALLSYFATF